MKPYRSLKIRELAQECPHCMYCKASNLGQVVAAHSNSQHFGKGMGQKAADMPIAYLCNYCHDAVDARSNAVEDPRDRVIMWMVAVCNTWFWLAQEGHLEVK